MRACRGAGVERGEDVKAGRGKGSGKSMRKGRREEEGTIWKLPL